MLTLKLIAPYTPPRTDRRVGGNRRLPTFGVCPVCKCVFGPLPKLSRRFCSMECKVRAQVTGRKKIRRTRKKARSAQSLLRYHIQAGHVVRPSACEECGRMGRRIEAAHYDYDEPLRVRWLCRSCHARWDKREPKGATFLAGEEGGGQTPERHPSGTGVSMGGRSDAAMA